MFNETCKNHISVPRNVPSTIQHITPHFFNVSLHPEFNTTKKPEVHKSRAPDVPGD